MKNLQTLFATLDHVSSHPADHLANDFTYEFLTELYKDALRGCPDTDKVSRAADRYLFNGWTKCEIEREERIEQFGYDPEVLIDSPFIEGDR
jgi:hypothetical protein